LLSLSINLSAKHESAGQRDPHEIAGVGEIHRLVTASFLMPRPLGHKRLLSLFSQELE